MMRSGKPTIIAAILALIGTNSFAELPELISVIKSDTNLTQFGRRIIPLGDQNADGYDDFLTWSYRVSMYLYYGGNPPDTIYALRVDSVQDRIRNVGDINEDNFDDVCVGGRTPHGWKLNVYYGGPSMDSIRDLWFGNDTLYGIGYTVYCDDINSNGTPELISWSNLHESVILFELGQNPDSVPDLRISPPNMTPYYDYYDAFGEGIISGDFNGDSFPDLGVNFRPREEDSLNGQVWLYWGGADFDTIPDMIIRRGGNFQQSYDRFGTVLEYLGDVNGDGYDDFFAGYFNSADDTSYIYFGGPEIDTIPDVIMSRYCEKARLAGDVNNDGYNDLITSFPLEFSALCRVYIYLGGPDMDSIPDLVILESDIPGYQNYFGNECSGVGDINGDGIDDFAFSAFHTDTIYNQGVIYIFAGWDSSTSVNYDYEPILPDKFELKQNFPNPFNSSTTISFTLPHGCQTRLVVYDVLGREIVSLINQELKAGLYRVNWNGRDKFNVVVSSGIYFCRLYSRDFSQSRKMILLR